MKKKCPYCDYCWVDENGKDVAVVGDFNVCIMCCGLSKMDNNVLIPFDIQLIGNWTEKNNIKWTQLKINEFWEQNTDKTIERQKYLNLKEQKNNTNKWISVKKYFPENNSFVYVKLDTYLSNKKKCFYSNKNFILRRELNVTARVTHWKLLK